MNFLKLNLNSYRNKLITLTLIAMGITSLAVNLNYNYDLSILPSNKRVYDNLNTLSDFPKGLVTLSIKGFSVLNDDDFNDIISWLDENNSSVTEIVTSGDDLIFKIMYKLDFNLSKYLNKIVLIPDAKLKQIWIDFNNNLIEIKLEKN